MINNSTKRWKIALIVLALARVSKTEGEWKTQWSMVYQHDTHTIDYYFKGEYGKPISFPVP